MKKRLSIKKLFDKRGLTYVELLVALALLALIVVSFTPMLLSSYDALYKAGEKTEEVYNSQQQIEEGLAVRSSLIKSDILMNFTMNSESILENINVTGRKIVSSLQAGLETMFYGVRARVDIISNTRVNDDQTSHEVILQTTGLSYSDVTVGAYSGDLAELPEDQIHIDAFIPDKDLEDDSGTTTDEVVYSTTRANLDVTEKDTTNGRIKFTVSGTLDGESLDFTMSPVKITVYYKNERGVLKTLSDYLYIDPPTIIIGGAFTDKDYVTTAGIEDKQDEESATQSTIYTLDVEWRNMRVTNSGFLTDSDRPSKAGTTIQTITWVNQDDNRQIAPYYVMAGTNSRVYRMYNYNAIDLTPLSAAGAKGADSRVGNTPDAPYDLADGSRAYQSFWSGEMSDQYYFKTLEHSSGYGAGEYVGSDCTQAQGDSNGYSRDHVGSRYDYFDKTLRYSMSFNGFSTGYDYQHLANRRISYVLTEAGEYSFRLGGRLRDGEFSDYSMPWEPAGTYYQGSGTLVTWKKGFIGIGKEERIIGGDSSYGKENPYKGVVYLEKYTGSGDIISQLFGGSQNTHRDSHFAYLRLKSYISVDPIPHTSARDSYFIDLFDKGDFWWPTGYNEEYGADKNITSQYPNDHDWISEDSANSVDITSSVFLQGAGSNGQGQVIYLGTVPAYAFIEQSSDIGTNEVSDYHALHVYNGKNALPSDATGYVVRSMGDAGTEIYRYCSKTDFICSVSDYFVDLCTDGYYNVTSALKEENDRYTFFTYPGSDTALVFTDTDLQFTFGYCSRWRMAIGDVTYDGAKEEARSYEKYYRLSNPEASYKLTVGQINNQGIDNLYYDVWFPGEYYNLTQVATCDEVTVAVGYAVSGSSFMKESAAWGSYGDKSKGFYGTALGSIYNDGVMAAYISEEAGGKVFRHGEKTTVTKMDGTTEEKTINLSGKGEQNVIFQNVLYYKSPTYIHDTLHSRANVRFTTVGLNAETTNTSDTTGTKKYYAYYADNNGDVYKSLVATAAVTGVDAGEDSYATETVVLNRVTDVVGSDNADTGMEKLLINGNPVSAVFKKVVSIDCTSDLIVISGEAKTASTPLAVLVGVKDDDGNWTWKGVQLGGFTNIYMTDVLMVNGYYYFVAHDGSNGYMGAVSMETLKTCGKGITLTPYQGKADNNAGMIWQGLGTGIPYAIGGRETN